MLYHGGSVLGSVNIYVDFWGTEWQAPSQASVMSYITGFFTDLGGSPWAGIMGEYCSGVALNSSSCPTGSSFIQNPLGQLKGSFIDTNPVPAAPTTSNIRSEAAAAAAHFGYPAGSLFMVYTPSGRSESGFGTSGGWCAYHTWVQVGSTLIPYGYMPYQPDAGAGCRANAVNGPLDGFSIVGGHEYAEAVTDPFPSSTPGYTGWLDPTIPNNQGEIGDKCVSAANVVMSGRTWPVQPLFSNQALAQALPPCVYSLNQPPVSTVTSITPALGPSAGGTSVTVNGTNFTGVTNVRFGSAPATYTVNSSAQIVATSPPGLGAANVTVTSSSGTSATSSVNQFMYQTPVVPPAVTALSPSSGSTAGGTPVSITGTGFSGATMVRFGANPASFTVFGTTQITATSPPGAGTLDVTVTTPTGTSATSSADLFTYLVMPPPPTVTAVTPGSGAGLGGTQVSISGSGLSGATTVKFGTTLATSFTIVGSTQITAVSPPGSGIVDLTVTTPNGTSAISVADRFTYVPDPGPPNSGRYHPVAPARILDTRFGIGAPVGPVGPQSTLTAQIAGQGGIPSTGVLAVVMNVTVTNTTAPSFLTIYPSGVSKPLASNLNWIPGQTVPNLVEVAVGSNGAVAAYNGAGSTDVIFDVAGYVSAPITNTGTDGLYKPVVPTRVLDTRTGNGGYSRPVGPGQTISIRVGGGAGTGIPATGVSATVLNFTVAGPTAPSFLTVYPMGGIQPNASNVNFVTGQTVPNRVIVKVGINPQTSTNGWLSIYNAAGWVDVVADVGGWFTDGTDPSATGAAFVGMTPTRLSDTRNGSGPLGAGATRVLQVGGQAGVPSTATAVVLNVTVTGPTATSFLTVWPDGAAQPLASDLNYGAGQTVPNLVVVKLGPNGAVDVYNLSGSTDVVVDIVGWYG
jgi:hypothetical protein